MCSGYSVQLLERAVDQACGVVVRTRGEEKVLCWKINKDGCPMFTRIRVYGNCEALA